MDWKRVDKSKLDITWENASIAFVCPCGTENVLSDEPKRCDCGRAYRYVTQLQVECEEDA